MNTYAIKKSKVLTAARVLEIILLVWASFIFIGSFVSVITGDLGEYSLVDWLVDCIKSLATIVLSIILLVKVSKHIIENTKLNTSVVVIGLFLYLTSTDLISGSLALANSVCILIAISCDKKIARGLGNNPQQCYCSQQTPYYNMPQNQVYQQNNLQQQYSQQGNNIANPQYNPAYNQSTQQVYPQQQQGWVQNQNNPYNGMR